MKSFFSICAVGVVLVQSGLISALPIEGAVSSLVRRDPALQNSPSGSYAPKNVDCPADLKVRNITKEGLPLDELAFMKAKTGKSNDKWLAYLAQARMDAFDIRAFLAKSKKSRSLPNVGIAVSGGGLRALLYGAGVLNAFDVRIRESRDAGTGGILQVTNYLSGLSGGSWLVGSWANANFPPMREMEGGVWRMSDNWADRRTDTPDQYQYVFNDITAKQKAGFPISAVDVLSRFFSHHLASDKMRGALTLFSSIRSVPRFQNHEAPYPIIIATSRTSPTASVSLSDPVYEFTPHAFGGFGASFRASIPIDYMGTQMTNGSPDRKSHGKCVVGFENSAFIMGTSADLLGEPAGKPFLQKILSVPPYAAALAQTPQELVDDAVVPNSFKGLSGPQRDQDSLYLADGGINGEYIPLSPLLQPERRLDVIIALDAIHDDSENYPNGMSLYTTYQKSLQQRTPFPRIPDVKTFVAQGLHKKSSFFGCDETRAPMVVYMPNCFVNSATNASMYKLDYTKPEVDGFFDNSFAIATQSHVNSPETPWRACLACALVDRQVSRNKQRRTPQCQACFQQYCR